MKIVRKLSPTVYWFNRGLNSDQFRQTLALPDQLRPTQASLIWLAVHRLNNQWLEIWRLAGNRFKRDSVIWCFDKCWGLIALLRRGDGLALPAAISSFLRMGH